MEVMKNIKYLVFFLIFLMPFNAFAGMFGPSNFWECILDEMPGVKNDAVANATMMKCRKKFPNTAYPQKKSSSLFGPKTANECIIKYAKDVSSPRGAELIRAACYRLYPRE
ncbi:MAG TPA: hypothetical protein DEB50_00065 [Desulfobacter sp.]|nr:hypothetical protein [Desulfobacter sp.]